MSYGDDRSPSAGLRLAAELRGRGYAVTAFRLGPGSGAASYDSAAAVAGAAPVTVFAVAIRPAPWHLNGITLPDPLARLIDGTAAARRAILVSEGTPYMVRETPAVSSYLLAWAADAVSETAVGRALAGAAPINGRLPITIPPRYPLGTGLERGAGVGATH